MADIKSCFSSNSDNWRTPSFIYDYFSNLGWFDPCPYNENPIIDGLLIDWHDHNFVNPPYTKIKVWINKAISEMKKGKVVCLLVPARTDTQWFKNLVYNHAHFIFLEGRLHFNDSKTSAPFPSMLVYLRPNFKDYEFDYYSKHDLLVHFGSNQ